MKPPLHRWWQDLNPSHSADRTRRAMVQNVATTIKDYSKMLRRRLLYSEVFKDVKEEMPIF